MKLCTVKIDFEKMVENMSFSAHRKTTLLLQHDFCENQLEAISSFKKMSKIGIRPFQIHQQPQEPEIMTWTTV